MYFFEVWEAPIPEPLERRQNVGWLGGLFFVTKSDMHSTYRLIDLICSKVDQLPVVSQYFTIRQWLSRQFYKGFIYPVGCLLTKMMRNSPFEGLEDFRPHIQILWILWISWISWISFTQDFLRDLGCSQWYSECPRLPRLYRKLKVIGYEHVHPLYPTYPGGS